jgi:hypothetical protein
MNKHFKRRIGWIGICIALAGCGATEPYVYKADEFDRDAPTFNQEPSDLTDVTVCYNAMASRPEEVATLADAACGKFAKRAERRSDTFGDCPVLTPHEARFECVRR